MATGTTLNLAPRPDLEQLKNRYHEKGRVTSGNGTPWRLIRSSKACVTSGTRCRIPVSAGTRQAGSVSVLYVARHRAYPGIAAENDDCF